LLQALWQRRLQGISSFKPTKRIGLCWAGNGITDIDHDRSLSPSEFDGLADVVNQHRLQFVSLQKGAAQLASSALPLIDLTSELGDWAETAALIANLDLVISCDTGIAHLSAAIGKPTWILNRFNGCWRWLTDRSDSPWYPTVRLFRQSKPGDWGTVIDEVAIALAAQLQHET
jgi:ADP-heptose:LPS heptosyltransferase